MCLSAQISGIVIVGADMNKFVGGGRSTSNNKLVRVRSNNNYIPEIFTSIDYQNYGTNYHS